MAEKNIAALVREDTKTIGVRFYQGERDYKSANKSANQTDQWVDIVDLDTLVSGLSPKEYTYVTHLDFKTGDLAIVKAAGELKVAYVSRVDEGCEIEPNLNVKFSWVVDRVNQDEYENQMNINKQLEDTVNKAYKQNVKNQFRSLVLGTIDSEAAAKINLLLGVTPK